MLHPAAVHRRGKGEVGVGQFGENVVRRLGHITGSGQKPLLGVREGMGPAALDVVKIAAVKGQLRLLRIEGLQPLLRDGENLRRLKGGGAQKVHIEGHGFAHHGLIGVHAGVLIAFALGIIQQLGEPLAGLLLQGDIVVQGIRTGIQTPGISAQGLDLGAEQLGVGMPCVVRWIEVGSIPGIVRRNFTAERDRFMVRHEESLLFEMMR